MDENWYHQVWRPLCAYVYLGLVIFDFILAPILMLFFAKITGSTLVMWKPLTLEGGGLVHLSFMSIITMTAWTRGKEKLAALEIAATTETKA
jgi:hypothetical protein